MTTTEPTSTAIDPNVARQIYQDDAQLAREFAEMYPNQKSVFCDKHKEICDDPSKFRNAEMAEAYVIAREVAHALVQVKKEQQQAAKAQPADNMQPEDDAPPMKRKAANDAPTDPVKAQAMLIEMRRKARMNPDERNRLARRQFEEELDMELAAADESPEDGGIYLPADPMATALNLLSGGTSEVKLKSYPSEEAFQDALFKDIQSLVLSNGRGFVQSAANGGRVSFDDIQRMTRTRKGN